MAKEEILGEALFHEEQEVTQAQDHGGNDSEILVTFGRRAFCKCEVDVEQLSRRTKETRSMTIHLRNAMRMRYLGRGARNAVGCRVVDVKGR